MKHPFRQFQYPMSPERISNRVVADEYAAVSAKIDALYGQPPELPADYETTGMARLRQEAHARMPGNGLCTRPPQLDCRLESACESCAYFRTGPSSGPQAGKQFRLGRVLQCCRPLERFCFSEASRAARRMSERR